MFLFRKSKGIAASSVCTTIVYLLFNGTLLIHQQFMVTTYLDNLQKYIYKANLKVMDMPAPTHSCMHMHPHTDEANILILITLISLKLIYFRLISRMCCSSLVECVWHVATCTGPVPRPVWWCWDQTADWS